MQINNSQPIQHRTPAQKKIDAKIEELTQNYEYGTDVLEGQEARGAYIPTQDAESLGIGEGYYYALYRNHGWYTFYKIEVVKFGEIEMGKITWKSLSAW